MNYTKKQKKNLILLLTYSTLILIITQITAYSQHHTVYLASPQDNIYTNQDNDTLKFIYSHTGYLTGTVNCTLYIDGTAVNHTENIAADTDTQVYSNQTISEATHNWWVNCTNGTGFESSIDIGENFTLNIDRTQPSTTFTSPTPADGNITTDNWAYINTTRTDAISPANLTTFIDWNYSLIGWWRFNEDPGENNTFFRDWSSYGNNGTCSGNCPDYIIGKFGKAVRFNQTSDSVTIPDSTDLDIVDEITIEFWAKLNNISIKSISTGSSHSCALLNNGSIMCWGSNSQGQLGDNSTTTKYAPVYVSGISTATDLSCGNYHACAVLDNGSAMCWGDNNYGQLGDNDQPTDKHYPVYVASITTASTISAGHRHTCTALDNGSAMCWGYNYYGQLGDNSTTSRYAPVHVYGITNATTISTKYFHTCAVLGNGSVMCWGYNDYGQLGNGDYPNKKIIPIYVSDITTATRISNGYRHTCAVLDNSNIMCWGDNSLGQIGDSNNPTDKHTPIYISSGIAASSLNLGYYHTCAVLDNGSAMCWGYNDQGQLGDGDDPVNKDSPVYVPNITNASTISAGYYHTCTALDNGSAMCWGNNGMGQLGDGDSPNNKNTPVYVLNITNASAISAGYYHSCASLDNGSAMCWGDNSEGQLGDNTTVDKDYPIYVSNMTNATDISCGDDHTCALLDNGSVMCWGYNNDGELGDNSTIDKELPVYVYGITNATAVSSGSYHTCALLDNRSVMCWGENGDGQLGDNDMGTDKNRPVYVHGITNAISISCMGYHSCALLDNGSVMCWGDNSEGQLGDGDAPTDKSTPAYTTGVTNATSIYSGYMHTCAIVENSEIMCWGSNEYGRLGDNSFRDTPKDTIMPLLAKSATAYGIWYNFGPKIISTFNNERLSSEILPDTWNHIALSYRKTENRLYVNGILKDSSSFSTPLPANNKNLTLTAAKYGGLIDEARIWKRALSQEEINASYNSGLYHLETNYTGLNYGTYNYTAYTQDLAGNINYTETRQITIQPSSDTTVPIITIANPTNTSSLPAGTTETTINITTDENAVCRYNTSDFNYTNGTNLTTTGETYHSFIFTSLTDSQTYNIYYLCNDSSGNINENPIHHTFSVLSAPYCGDGDCNNGETCATCPGDCGTCNTGGGGSSVPYIMPEDNQTNQTQEIEPISENTTTTVITENESTTNTTDTTDTTTTQPPEPESKSKAKAKIEQVKKKLIERDNKETREKLEEAQIAYSIGDYDNAYDLALKAEKMHDEIRITPEKKQFPPIYIILLIILIMIAISILYKYTQSKKTIPKTGHNLHSNNQKKK